MYIEYTPIDLFDEAAAEHHLQQAAATAATTTIGFAGVDDDDDGFNFFEDNCDDNDDEISIVQNGNGFFELKKSRLRPPKKRKCSDYFPAIQQKSIKRSYFGGSSGSQASNSSGIPMGFDIIAKIRKLFGDSGEGGGAFGRKRRADDNNWNSNSSQFKYRRVDNEFPKFVKKSFEEGMVWRPYPIEDEIKIVPQRLHKSPLVMAQQNQKEKRSQFVRPKTVTKHITNTNFADIEFSDDDEDTEIIITNSRGEAVNVVHQPSISRSAAISRANIMPSTSSGKMTNIPFKQRQPPPPLIQASTGGILASTLMPGLQPIQPTYSSILSACTNGFHGVAPKRSVVPKDTIHRTSSPFLFNGGGSMLNSLSSYKGARSIIAQENLSKDQEQYRELLQKLMPNLYGIKGTSPKLPFAAKSRLSIVNRTKEPVASVDLTADRSSANRKASTGENILTLDLSDDDDVSDIIDLADEELNMLSACSKIQEDQSECTYDLKRRAAEKKKQLPFVEPVNTLKEKFDLSPVCQTDWLENFNRKWQKKHLEGKQKIAETEKEVEELSAETRDKEKEMQQRLKDLQIVDPDLVIIDDFPEDDEEPEYPPITPEHEAIIKGALFGGPADQMLISKFNMSITRRDIATLMGKTWLNDEVINFYMCLLTERGELRHEEGLPKVYAMNTFFVPRLMQSGHSGVRRWTRKVDIFTYDVLPVPVHVGGVHWCMAIIHLRDRSIKYYDSMGTPNPKILSALEQYLRDESLDKRKRPFDTSGFLIESVRNVPQQNNGSDCGVFSCMFAEFISRDREITFSQQHMEYFRHKMILEIAQGQLMQ
ncbi:uncharacterized protein LOC129911334 isoform X2 [Episyrphus balteatus]|uniref:uncharacterized protein LOC129911334 isoform X2 n=1 Tax=Episyrphus balteatus TaxID=286459 RepID=UPI0024863D52|nr:uncharacterized protein LOC129911334 isoform X2 [Episyrphus balteatus]